MEHGYRDYQKIALVILSALAFVFLLTLLFQWTKLRTRSTKISGLENQLTKELKENKKRSIEAKISKIKLDKLSHTNKKLSDRIQSLEQQLTSEKNIIQLKDKLVNELKDKLQVLKEENQSLKVSKSYSLKERETKKNIPIKPSPNNLALNRSVIDNSSYKQVGKIKRYDFAGHKRIKAYIVMPLGRTKKQVESTLSKAVVEIGKQNHAKCTVVWGLRPNDPTDKAATVGAAFYAPNGEWGDVLENDPLKVKVVLGSVYFDVSKPPKFKINQNIVLRSKYTIWLYDKPFPEHYTNDASGQIQSGSNATILARKTFADSMHMLDIMYKVKGRSKNKSFYGWVFERDISEK